MDAPGTYVGRILHVIFMYVTFGDLGSPDRLERLFELVVFRAGDVAVSWSEIVTTDLTHACGSGMCMMYFGVPVASRVG